MTQGGDKNTRYFHAACNARQRNNSIQKLIDENGRWVDWQNGLQILIHNYHNDLFTSAPTDVGEIIECVPCSITQEQNA